MESSVDAPGIDQIDSSRIARIQSIDKQVKWTSDGGVGDRARVCEGSVVSTKRWTVEGYVSGGPVAEMRNGRGGKKKTATNESRWMDGSKVPKVRR